MNPATFFESAKQAGATALQQSQTPGLSSKFGEMLSAAKNKLDSVKNGLAMLTINPLEVIAQFSNSNDTKEKKEYIRKAARLVGDIKTVEPDTIERKLTEITTDPGFIKIMKDINLNPNLQKKIKNTMDNDKDFVNTWIRALSANLTDGDNKSFIELFGSAVDEIKNRPDAAPPPPQVPFSTINTGNPVSGGDTNAAAPSISAGMNEAIEKVKEGEQKDVNCGEMTKVFISAFGKILENGSDLPERALLVDFIKNQIKEYEATLLPAIANSLQISAQSKQYFLKKLGKAMAMKKNTRVSGGRKTQSKKKLSKKKRTTRRRR
jgi:hypothetical protein